jgi:hypothetical protein
VAEVIFSIVAVGASTSRLEHRDVGRETMIDDPAISITDADVRSLAAKLKGLHALLTPPEQELLHTVLRRATASDGADWRDTGGFAWAVSFNPFPYLDAVAVDLPRDAAPRDP